MADKPRQRSSRNGYGWHHQKLRQQMLPHAWGTLCHFCGLPMIPGQPLDLDHTDDRRSYRGMTHRACNRADGARKVNAKRNSKGPLFNPRAADW